MAFAGITADSIFRESVGSLTLIQANFSALTSGLWIGGVPNAVTYWGSGESTGVNVSTAMANASATGSSAGVYFYMISDNAGSSQQGKLFVLSRM